MRVCARLVVWSGLLLFRKVVDCSDDPLSTEGWCGSVAVPGREVCWLGRVPEREILLQTFCLLRSPSHSHCVCSWLDAGKTCLRTVRCSRTRGRDTEVVVVSDPSVLCCLCEGVPMASRSEQPGTRVPGSRGCQGNTCAPCRWWCGRYEVGDPLRLTSSSTVFAQA